MYGDTFIHLLEKSFEKEEIPLLLLAVVLHPVSYSYFSELSAQSSKSMHEKSFLCSVAVLYYKKFI